MRERERDAESVQLYAPSKDSITISAVIVNILLLLRERER